LSADNTRKSRQRKLVVRISQDQKVFQREKTMNAIQKISQRAALFLTLFSLINAMVVPGYALTRAPLVSTVRTAPEISLTPEDSSSKAEEHGTDKAERADLKAPYTELPLGFEINQGQADRHVKFLAQGSAGCRPHLHDHYQRR
jgi:hypothetical protein